MLYFDFYYRFLHCVWREGLCVHQRAINMRAKMKWFDWPANRNKTTTKMASQMNRRECWLLVVAEPALIVADYKSQHSVGKIIDYQMWWFMPLKWIKSMNIHLRWNGEATGERTSMRRTLYPALDGRSDEPRSEWAVREIGRGFDAPTKHEKPNTASLSRPIRPIRVQIK